MSAHLRVEQVSLAGRGGSYTWRFIGPVTVLQGPVGVGKTSLLELIKYGLGGGGLLSKTVREVGQRVAITISVPAGEYVLVRGIGDGANRVRVATGGAQPVANLSVRGGPNEEQTISTWLLDQLAIPSALRLPRSRARPRDEFTRITWGDVYTYLYLEQSEIDRSTARDLDPIRDPKRRQTFELLYRLLGPDIAALQVRIAELERAVRDARATEASIVEFLKRLDVPSTAALERETATLAGHLADVERTLLISRREASATTTSLRLPRGEVAELRAEIEAARAERRLAAQELEALTRLRARVALEHERTFKALVAGGVFAATAWELCPRCLQALAVDHPSLHCIVCGQLEPPSLPPDELEAEQDRLRLQLGETDELIGRARRVADVAEERERRVAAALARREADIDRAAQESVAPYVDRIAELTGDTARIGARLQELARWQRLADELAEVQAAGRSDQERLASLREELARAQDEADVGRARIGELSALFSEILERFEQPWFQEQGGQALIDPVTYRPVVNGQNLPEQMSGGMKVITNVAYYLAGLTYALQSPNDSLLPTFMVLDTPRKNFGSGPVTAERLNGSTTGSMSCEIATAAACN